MNTNVIIYGKSTESLSLFTQHHKPIKFPTKVDTLDIPSGCSVGSVCEAVLSNCFDTSGRTLIPGIDIMGWHMSSLCDITDGWVKLVIGMGPGLCTMGIIGIGPGVRILGRPVWWVICATLCGCGG